MEARKIKISGKNPDIYASPSNTFTDIQRYPGMSHLIPTDTSPTSLGAARVKYVCDVSEWQCRVISASSRHYEFSWYIHAVSVLVS